MIKLITAKLFSAAIAVDANNKIINTPPHFKNFIGQSFYVLEQVLMKNKFQSLSIENVEEI